MQATLTFDLDEPEQRTEHLRCVKALDLAITLFDIEQALRLLRKADSEITIEEVEELFYAKLSENNVNLQELLR